MIIINSFSESFCNSFKKKEVEPNYGMDQNKVAKLEEVISEMRFSKVMSPYEVKKIEEKIIKRTTKMLS